MTSPNSPASNQSLQGSAKRRASGCVNAAGMARQKWQASAATKFTKPGASHLAEPYNWYLTNINQHTFTQSLSCGWHIEFLLLSPLIFLLSFLCLLMYLVDIWCVVFMLASQEKPDICFLFTHPRPLSSRRTGRSKRICSCSNTHNIYLSCILEYSYWHFICRWSAKHIECPKYLVNSFP